MIVKGKRNVRIENWEILPENKILKDKRTESGELIDN